MWLLSLWLGVALAADGGQSIELARQSAMVSLLAQQAAEARDGGASRATVARAMARYRAQAQRLAALREAALAAEQDAAASARRQARADLAEALATGKDAAASREVLGAWLGDLSGQIEVMDQVFASLQDRPHDDLWRDLLLDLAERAELVALVASYDVSRLIAEAELAELRGRSRRRDSSGMAHDLGALLEARQLEEDAKGLRRQAAGVRVVRDEALKRQSRALGALQDAP